MMGMKLDPKYFKLTEWAWQWIWGGNGQNKLDLSSGPALNSLVIWHVTKLDFIFYI
jgi:hypothetical protein